ncbi:hypothetical protein LTR05_005892 [Lithohypha guttulata]|uniref:Aminoglycoside phosphotransferase domain-containing protein n=1 Tax=Lithohypha guttulata TaxID=1690604 RepID=A0AAN7SYP5_9EURO|nr:hypothetical protein LTR05_005892 [Lithohypha guttulata]
MPFCKALGLQNKVNKQVAKTRRVMKDGFNKVFTFGTRTYGDDDGSSVGADHGVSEPRCRDADIDSAAVSNDVNTFLANPDKLNPKLQPTDLGAIDSGIHTVAIALDEVVEHDAAPRPVKIAEALPKLCSNTSRARPLEEYVWTDEIIASTRSSSIVSRRNCDEDGMGGKMVHEENEDCQDVESDCHGCTYDLLAPFRCVVAALDLEKLRQIALAQRHNLVFDADHYLDCEIDPTPRCGSYNFVYILTFSDGVKWCARVPGYGRHPVKTLAEKMKIEYNTVQYIKHRTSIPVPKVYYWTTDVTEAGVAFGLIGFMEGQPLSELWWDKETFGEEQRALTLASIASHMQQLYKIQFEKTGMLRWDSSNPDLPAEVSYELDYYANEECLWAGTIKRKQREDFFGEWIRRTMKGAKKGELVGHDLRAEKALRRLAKSMPKQIARAPFSLSLADLDLQNVFVDPDTGTVTGYIDFDGVAVKDVQIGAAAYPKWLLRDMDLTRYSLDPRQGYHSPFENTLEELADYRSWYKCCWITAWKEDKLGEYNSRWTGRSHILTCIQDALVKPLTREFSIWALVDYAYREAYAFDDEERGKLWDGDWHNYDLWRLRYAIAHGIWNNSAKRAWCVISAEEIADNIRYYAGRPVDYWRTGRAFLNI